MYYMLRSAVDSGIFTEGEGKSTIYHLTAETLRAHRLPFPARNEQQRIVRFLDHETARIDALIAKKTESMEVRKAKQAPKPKSKRKAKARSRAKVQESAKNITEDITETTPHGYFAKLIRRSKQESQPWEIFLSIDGAKPKFCCRERSRQDAEERCWKLDRFAEEEKLSTPTTTNNEAAEAAAM